jgi:pimeloyl-ACP methyl ester carboxylesterase
MRLARACFDAAPGEDNSMIETRDTSSSTAGGLVVYVPGMRARRAEKALPAERRVEALLAGLRAEPRLAGFDFFVYPRAITRFSRGNLSARGDELADVLDEYWCDNGRPEKVILIGHSIGGLLVRHAYLAALADARKQPWARCVERIVLLAAPNRGFNPRRIPALYRGILSAALAVPPFARRYVWTDAVVGAPYLTDLRMRWIQTMTAEDPPDVIVVQVVGHDDSSITFDDSVDIEVRRNSRTVGIAFADHQTVVSPESPLDPDREQFRRLVKTVTGEDDPADGDGADDTPPPAGDVTDVVFLIHGIRANAYGWVRMLSDRIEKEGNKVTGRKFRSVHPSYGYLAAFNFAIPFGHDRQLRAFADWYTEQYARYPHANFHFVGHSNGTYIFGKSLHRVPSMQFTNVYLGGSVLPTNWTVRNGQVLRLVNVCGTGDIPVGILCGSLHGLLRRDVGTGGFAGFDNPPPDSKQWVSVRGGHGTAFKDERLPAVARFIVAGDPPPDDDIDEKRWARVTTKYLFGFASRLLMIVSPWLVAAALAGLGFLVVSSGTAAVITLGSLLVLVTLLRAL